MYSSHLIPVEAGDVICFGLVNLSQKWHIATYAADGTKKANVSKGDTAGNYTAVVYQDLDGTLENVALAVSDDGINWTKEGVILYTDRSL